MRFVGQRVNYDGLNVDSEAISKYSAHDNLFIEKQSLKDLEMTSL